MERLLLREEAAKLLRKKESWLKWAERHGVIPHLRVGRAVRYRESDLAAWVEQCTVRPTETGEPQAEPVASEGT